MGSVRVSDEVEELARLCQVAPGSIEDVYACTPIQEALMAASTEISNSYVLQMVSRLNQELDIEKFKRAWQETALANAILRTRIVEVAGSGSRQVVVDEQLEWTTSDALKSYLKRDISLPMTYGNRLWRYGIVSSPSTEERFFIWTAHHAVCDGYALSELLKGAGLRFKKLPIPSAPPYKEFIEYLKAVDTERGEKYWRKELGASSSLHFPAISGLGHRAVPSSGLSRDIHIKWPEGLKISKALILQSAWAVLISNHTGSSDVTFPTVSSGRTAPILGIRQMTGPAFTLVPISFKIDPAQTIGEFFMSAYLRHKEMTRFEQTGLANIRRYLGQEGTRICDFQNLLVVQPGAFTDMATDAFKYLGMNILKEHWKYETHSYPLVTTLTYTRGGFHLRFEYDPQILHDKEIFNLANQYEEIVHQFCATAPTQRMGSISALSSVDKDQIFAWNVSTPICQNICIHELVHKQAARSPDAPAVCSWEGKLTYQQVEDISSDLASELIDAGVQPGDLVAVCFKKSIWAAVAILAILKAGAAYVPLDSSHPKARLQEIIEVTGIGLAVTSSECAALLKGICRDIVPFNGSNLSQRDQNHLKIPHLIAPSSIAYVLFTSGSTGKPKGVAVQHSAICTSMAEHGKALGFSSSWRVLQFSSYTFDVSIAEIFTTLAFGGCVCVPSNEQRMNDVSGAIRNLNVNVALLTPTVATLLIPEEVPSLHTLVLGGEAITQEQVNRWRGHVRVANGFGPTEASVYCSINADLLSASATNIGTSVGGHNWIVDPLNHESLTPLGCVGELVISGPSIAKEYFSNTIETDAAFVSGPRWLAEVGHASARIYKTGDLVKYKHDGTMEFIARKDTQVKIRGLRIELGEVQSRLSQISKARAVIVMAPKTGLCSGKLVAIVCFNHNFGSEVSTSSIELDPDFVSGALGSELARSKVHLASNLPDYMIPNIWVVLSRFPMLSSGKIDQREIGSFVEGMSSETYKVCSRSFDVPTSDEVNKFTPGSLISELRLAWSHVLNVPRDSIGASTTFFSLGGDSISAMQIVTRCRNAGINISVKDILLSRSLAKLELLANRDSVKSRLEPEAPNALFELSPVQKMFFLQNGPRAESVRYNHGFKAKLKGGTEMNDLIAAFDALVDKHPMLRARFVNNDDGWRQFCCEPGRSSYRMKVHEFIAQDEIDSIVEEGHTSINVLKGPTFSVDIFQSEEITHMFVTAHHLVVDLVSWRVILQDLEDFLKTGTVSPPSGLSFSSWCRALEDRFGAASGVSENHEVDKRSTNHELWGLSTTDNVYGNAEKTSWSLDAECTKLLLQQVGPIKRTEPIDLMVSAIVSSFRQVFSGTPSPEVFIEGHGREPWTPDLDIWSTVGWFTTTYPIRNLPATNRGINSLLQHIKKIRRSFPDHGLEHFSRSYLGSNDGETNPLRGILLNYQGLYQQLENEESLFSLEDVEHTPVSSDVQRNALFEIEARIRSGCLEFSFAYNKKSKHQEDIRDWVQKIKSSLLEISFTLSSHQGPQSVGDFMVLEEPETRRLDALLYEKVGGAVVVIEDMFHCSEMQSHMLRTQLRDPSCFTVQWGIEVTSQTGREIKLRDLKQAWSNVVRKYQALRTIFLVDPFDEGSVPIQVVLEDPEPPLTIQDQTCHPILTKCILPHHLMLSTTKSGSVICQFEASHAILDGFSLRLLMRDFLAAYQGNLSHVTSSAISFNDTTMKITQLKQEPNCSMSLPSPQNPCILLPFYTQPARQPTQSRFTLASLPTFNKASLLALCNKHDITLSSLIDASWAQTLGALTSQTSVTFGYVSSIRTPEAHEVAGPMIEVLACCIEDMRPSSDLIDIAKQIQQLKIEGQKSIYGSSKQRGFNTAVNFQRVEGDRGKERTVGDLRIRELEFSDPWDVSLASLVISYLAIGNDFVGANSGPARYLRSGIRIR